MNGYELSRMWFDFSFENPEKIKPSHGILYFFIIEHCNRLGWKEKFGLPTTMAKEAIGIRSYNTYINTLNDLVDWGFIKMIEKSKNQYSSNIVAISKFNKALDKALDKALIKHGSKQRESIDSIDKQLNNLTIKQKTIKQFDFDLFWNLYNKKSSDKKTCFKKWCRLSNENQKDIMIHLPSYVKSTPDKEFRKNAETYLNQEHWKNEVLEVLKKGRFPNNYDKIFEQKLVGKDTQDYHKHLKSLGWTSNYHPVGGTTWRKQNN